MSSEGHKSSRFMPEELFALRTLASRFPTVSSAVAEIAYLEAVMGLPKGRVHIISDVHGDHKKLHHILSNASGSLRLFLEELFESRLSASEKTNLLNTIYYPLEMFENLALRHADAHERGAFVRETLRRQIEILAALSQSYSLKHVERVWPFGYGKLFGELLWEMLAGRPRQYMDTMIRTLTEQGRGLEVVSCASKVIRDLSVFELVVAGDLGDRGPRLDKVTELLMGQPRVAITWGNHDMSWMGASLGHDLLIATVLRLSIRYRQLSQVEEGFGITIQPLEKLAREVYGNDPARCFDVKGHGLRDAVQMARMQKAIAVIQFKLEAQVIARHPEYEMEERALINRINFERGTVSVDEMEYRLTDLSLPTVDSKDPARLSPEEVACVDRLRRSFLESRTLTQQMRFVEQRGSSSLIRDGHLIFHGCVPVDEAGNFLSVPVNGRSYEGRALFVELDEVVHRAFRERRADDLDMLWYLWTGPLSPMFGKDKMATFESYFIEDESTHHETKNPYFRLTHTGAFCRTVLEEFGVDASGGMIVNGHVPVRVESGERPLKDSNQAITIDGAFSESYGDRGYTLILDELGTRLAEHSHFESVAEALCSGADIVPTVEEIRNYDQPHCVADTEQGTDIRGEIEMLKRLVKAYESGVLYEDQR